MPLDKSIGSRPPRTTCEFTRTLAPYLLRSPIGQLEARLDPSRFVRIHRATIVNLTRLTELRAVHGEAFVAVLAHGVRRRVSRQGKLELERALGQRL